MTWSSVARQPWQFDNLHRVANLYRQPLPASRGGAMYNAFPYPTKISAESIAVFLATHTQPGDTVLDCFAGAGSVGLAGLLCDRPTPAMKAMARTLEVVPKWGPRNVVLYELSVLGALAAKVLCSRLDPAEFEHAARDMVDRARRRLPNLYSVQSPDGTQGELRYAVWSEVLICTRCEHETPFWDAAARRRPARLIESFKCRGCGKRVQVAACARATEKILDRRLGQTVERRRRVMSAVYGRSAKTAWSRAALSADEQANRWAEQEPWPRTAPTYELFWGDLHRSGYHLGISHLHHFYTSRNFLAVSTLLEIADTYGGKMRDALRLLVLSYNIAHCTLMTRIVAKKGQNDFSVTSAQSGVLYVSALPVEKNVFDGVLRKVKPFKESFAITAGSKSKVSVRNSSSAELSLDDGSVQYVFTDPPFGDYIPYAEINQISEAWLGSVTNRAEEVIVSSAQGKSINDYGRLMASVFSEISRVLAADGLATVVFHSADSKIWHALTRAYASAHLKVHATSVLDKSQSSFKQVVSLDSVKGDPLMLLSKHPHVDAARPVRDNAELLHELFSIARTLPEVERQPQRLYSRFVALCLDLGIDVSMGAKEFYGAAREAIKCTA